MSINKIKVTDWGSKKTVSLDDFDKGVLAEIRSLEERLPTNLKLKLGGAYHSGYGISMGKEEYTINLQVVNKKSGLAIYTDQFMLKRDLTPYRADFKGYANTIVKKFVA